jgi:cell division protein YceG involved in septum cleavage
MNKSFKTGKIELIGRAVFLTLLTYILVISVYRKPESSDLLTTNIDIKNEVINDDGIDVSDDEIVSFLGNILQMGQKWLSQNLNAWRLYQNMANPYSRYVVLNSGLRKEEVANILSKELKWDEQDKDIFLAMDQIVDKEDKEGYYYPAGYLLPSSAKPRQAYEAIMKKFDQEIEEKYTQETAQIINIDVAMKIASIIEREAAGVHDMRLISGVIWNRIFKDMNLEMDATLQYIKGNDTDGWWPRVDSEDKYLDSPYNTYQNKGLPPTPISNVSIAAIKAALNPKKTNCIFYLHDKRGKIHCSVTYKEHLTNIRRYYGKK